MTKTKQPSSTAPEFELRSDGIYHNHSREPGAAVRIASRIEKRSTARDNNSSNWLDFLTWKDPAGITHDEPFSRAEFSRAGGAGALDRLACGGADVPVLAPQRTALIRYLAALQPLHTNLERISDIVGWCGSAFVTHSCVYTADDPKNPASETIRFVGRSPDACSQKGALEDWQQNIARLAVGNPLMMFSISFAFAAPLMKLAQLDNAGVHFVGETSTGKSTLLQLCASVFGKPRDYIRQWATTQAALESLCQAANDLPLILDEIGQIDPRDAGRAAYLISNGTARNRSQASGGLRQQPSWRNALVSAGEKNLAQVMAEAGQSIKGGQAARLADIPADAGHDMGIIESLHEFGTSRQMVDHLRSACSGTHGTAGAAYLASLTQAGVAESLAAELPQELTTFSATLKLPDDAAPEVGRVAKVFALAGVAGDLASQLGITGWSPEAASDAARSCFSAWLRYRGSTVALDRKLIFDGIQKWLQANAGSRLPPTTTQNHTLPPGRDHAGFTMYDRENGVKAFLIYPHIFYDECLADVVDKELAMKLLVKAGWITRDKDHIARKERIAALGKSLRMIRLTPLAFGAEDDGHDDVVPNEQPVMPAAVRKQTLADEFDR